jgi:site-specific DNA recombinase
VEVFRAVEHADLVEVLRDEHPPETARSTARTRHARPHNSRRSYHYYACSGRQKLGRKSCDGERLPKDKLEAAILHQLTGLYRDGSMIRNAIEQAAESNETDRAALTEKRASLAKEIARAERAIERYQDAFENGDLDPVRFKQRLSALDARLDALHGQDQALALEMAADTPATPDTATLHAVADQLDHVVTHGEPEQAKALLAILIAELRVNSRAEVLPTYRVGTPTVCAPTSSVELVGLEPTASAMPWRRSPS